MPRSDCATSSDICASGQPHGHREFGCGTAPAAEQVADRPMAWEAVVEIVKMQLHGPSRRCGVRKRHKHVAGAQK